MAIEERDAHSGYLTTGHEWNGIKELNTPVPRAVYFFLIATAIFSFAYWVLMPSWPTGVSFTRGLLGNDQRSIVAKSVRQADLERGVWTKRIASESYSAVQANPDLMKLVRESGRTLFGDNCAACHGADARGGKGFPNLTASSWIWGGSPEAIAETIRVGVNSPHKDSRISQMLAFGRNQMVSREEALNVAEYVRSLSDAGPVREPAGKLAAGKQVFLKNCASCHGDDGKGKNDVGAPDLTDRSWIYGGDLESIYQTIWNGRQGRMPSWENRLSDLDRKILTLYVVDLRTPR
ncbi:MAG: cytochrome-c oxidase, cbb3-type subunit III [Rhizobiales bacterium 65-9]|nr:MAG: cytochrome-c oxidase, cbb3-type subunit III [Rhizobiales bacterium 65-9]